MAYGIDRQSDILADLNSGNPQNLQQRVQQNRGQDIVEVLALQKVKNDKEAAARGIQMSQQTPANSVKDQLEQQVMGMTRQEVAQRVAPGLAIQGQRMQQQQMGRPPMPQRPAMPGGGLAGLPQARPPMPQGMPQGMPRMAAGGGLMSLRGYADGGFVEPLLPEDTSSVGLVPLPIMGAPDNSYQDPSADYGYPPVTGIVNPATPLLPYQEAGIVAPNYDPEGRYRGRDSGRDRGRRYVDSGISGLPPMLEVESPVGLAPDFSLAPGGPYPYQEAGIVAPNYDPEGRYRGRDRDRDRDRGRDRYRRYAEGGVAELPKVSEEVNKEVFQIAVLEGMLKDPNVPEGDRQKVERKLKEMEKSDDPNVKKAFQIAQELQNFGQQIQGTGQANRMMGGGIVRGYAEGGDVDDTKPKLGASPNMGTPQLDEQAKEDAELLMMLEAQVKNPNTSDPEMVNTLLQEHIRRMGNSYAKVRQYIDSLKGMAHSQSELDASLNGMMGGGIVSGYAEGGDVGRKPFFDQMGRTGANIPAYPTMITTRNPMGPFGPGSKEFNDELAAIERERREEEKNSINLLEALLYAKRPYGFYRDSENDLASYGGPLKLKKKNPIFTEKLKAMKAAEKRGYLDGGYIEEGRKVLEEEGMTLEEILDAIKFVESTDNPNAVSPAGARGLYQIMLDTAGDPGYGVTPIDLENATEEQQRRLAEEYFLAMVGRFGNVDDALQAYNAGPGRVLRGGELPKETIEYPSKVLARYEEQNSARRPETPTSTRASGRSPNGGIVGLPTIFDSLGGAPKAYLLGKQREHDYPTVPEYIDEQTYPIQENQSSNERTFRFAGGREIATNAPETYQERMRREREERKEPPNVPPQENEGNDDEARQFLQAAVDETRRKRERERENEGNDDEARQFLQAAVDETRRKRESEGLSSLASQQQDRQLGSKFDELIEQQLAEINKPRSKLSRLADIFTAIGASQGTSIPAALGYGTQNLRNMRQAISDRAQQQRQGVVEQLLAQEEIQARKDQTKAALLSPQQRLIADIDEQIIALEENLLLAQSADLPPEHIERLQADINALKEQRSGYIEQMQNLLGEIGVGNPISSRNESVVDYTEYLSEQ